MDPLDDAEVLELGKDKHASNVVEKCFEAGLIASFHKVCDILRSLRRSDLRLYKVIYKDICYVI